jgi:hypothetical protein
MPRFSEKHGATGACCKIHTRDGLSRRVSAAPSTSAGFHRRDEADHGLRHLAEGRCTLAGDRRVSGTLSVTQSEWGIKPYRAFMGALRVGDTAEVVLEVTLPMS